MTCKQTPPFISLSCFLSHAMNKEAFSIPSYLPRSHHTDFTYLFIYMHHTSMRRETAHLMMFLQKGEETATMPPKNDPDAQTPFLPSETAHQTEFQRPSFSEMMKGQKGSKKSRTEGESARKSQERIKDARRDSSSLTNGTPSVGEGSSTTAPTKAKGTAEDNSTGRERLKRHRVEVAGRVWIPEMWGQEDYLKDWIDCTVFDAGLKSSSIMSARASLVEEARRANSSRFRIENRC